MRLLLHPTTAYQLEIIAQGENHAILITGADGMGKTALAEHLVKQLLKVSEPSQHPYFRHIEPIKQTISIEAIRDLRDFLQRKTTGQGTIRRVVIISQSHLMTTEAQNAILKTLEEPPTDTVIILTASDLTGLKPTIRSRAQQLQVQPVELSAAQKHFTADAKTIETAFYMSDGRPGLMSALLNNEDHELVRAINQAKHLLKLSMYERLLAVDEMSKQKESLPMLLTGLQRVVNSGLKQATAKNNTVQARQFHRSSTAIYRAQAALATNGNAKLVLTNLCLQM